MSKFCSESVAPITDEKFCSECGAKIRENNIDSPVVKPTDASNSMCYNENPSQQPISQFPTDIQLKNRKKAKGCLISFLVVIFAILGLLIVIIATSSDDDSNNPNTNQQQNVDTVIQHLTEIGLTEDEAKAVKADLESVGITSLSSLEKAAGTGIDELQAFVFSGSGVSGTLTIEKRKTYFIGSGNITLFDASKGGKIDTITRYILTSDEKIHFMVSAQDYVKQCLKSPSSAKFESTVTGEWSVSRKDDTVTIASYVESQNSFGAMIREEYVVQISYSTDNCLYCQIGSQVAYGTYQK